MGLDAKDSVVGLLVFTVDESVTLGDVWGEPILLVALSCTMMKEEI